jgi:hypothetical protein
MFTNIVLKLSLTSVTAGSLCSRPRLRVVVRRDVATAHDLCEIMYAASLIVRLSDRH